MEEMENIKRQAEELFKAADELIRKNKRPAGPKIGDMIWFVNKYFEPDYKEYLNDSTDMSLKLAGNFFLDRRDAQDAAKDIQDLILDH